jgi:hypothetical protein
MWTRSLRGRVETSAAAGRSPVAFVVRRAHQEVFEGLKVLVIELGQVRIVIGHGLVVPGRNDIVA